MAALAAFFIFTGMVSARGAHADASAAVIDAAVDPYFIVDEKPSISVTDEGALSPSVLDAQNGLDALSLDTRPWWLPTPEPTTKPSGTSIDEAEIVLDKVINMGKKVWAIVEANKPVVNVQTDTANALPQGATGWSALEGWQRPRSVLYKYTYKNGFRMKVVEFSFRVLYTYGGSVNGKGRFLANVTVVPADLNVLWGYKFNAKASVPSVLNASTVPGEPLAAAELLVDWTVETVLKHSRKSLSMYVRGDGSFNEL